MKKNGFIATSLIYSFFLIFVTLFLTIIADYLQNKVLLNSIEKGIKDELNSTMSIEDFEVGDILSFEYDYNEIISGTSTTIISNGETWIVGGIDTNSKQLIVYSYSRIYCKELDKSEVLSVKHIMEDLLLSGNLTNTKIKNILTLSEGNYYIKKSNGNYGINWCFDIEDNSIDEEECNLDISEKVITKKEDTNTKPCRQRKLLNIGTRKFQYENSPDGISITITREVS